MANKKHQKQSNKKSNQIKKTSKLSSKQTENIFTSDETSKNDINKIKRQLQKQASAKTNLSVKDTNLVLSDFVKKVSEISSDFVDSDSSNDIESPTKQKKRKYKRIFSSFSAFFPTFKQTSRNVDDSKVFLIMSDNFFLSEKLITNFLEVLSKIFQIQGMPVCSTKLVKSDRPLIVPIINEIKEDDSLLEDDIAFDNFYIDSEQNIFFHSISFLHTWTLSQNHLLFPCFSWKDFLDAKYFFEQYDTEVITIYVSNQNKIPEEFSSIFNMVDYKIISKKLKTLQSFFFNVINLFFDIPISTIRYYHFLLNDRIKHTDSALTHSELMSKKREDVEKIFGKK